MWRAFLLLIAVLTACQGEQRSPQLTAPAPRDTIPATIVFDRGALTLRIGQADRLIATVKAASGAVLSSAVTWVSSDSLLLAVDSTGSVLARAPGSVDITAQAGGVIARASVQVTVPAPDTGEMAVTVRVELPSGSSLNASQLRYSAGIHSAGLTSSGTVRANVPSTATGLVTASTRQDAPLLLAISSADTFALSLSAQSTAEALVFLVPGIATSDPDSARQTIQMIRGTPGLSELTRLIENRMVQNPQTALTEVDSVVVQSLRAVASDIGRRRREELRRRARALAPNNGTTRSGIKASLRLGAMPTVELTNTRGRWLSVAVSSSEDGRTFASQPDLELFPWIPRYRIGPSKVGLLGEQSTTGVVPVPAGRPYVRVTALGPGSPWVEPFTGQHAKLAPFPTIATAVFSFVVPTVQIISGIKGINNLPIWDEESAVGILWLKRTSGCLTETGADIAELLKDILLEQDWVGLASSVGICSLKALITAEVLKPLALAIGPKFAEFVVSWSFVAVKIPLMIYSITKDLGTVALGLSAILTSNSSEVFEFRDPLLVPVARVGVQPQAVQLSRGETRQLTASVQDGLGQAIDGRPIVWESSAPSVATVSPTGLVTATGPGRTVVTATVSNKSGSTIVDVPLPTPSALIRSLVTPDGSEVDLTRVSGAFTANFAVSPNGVSVDSVAFTIRREGALAVTRAGLIRFSPALTAVASRSVSLDPTTVCPNGLMRLQMIMWYRIAGQSIELRDALPEALLFNLASARCVAPEVRLAVNPASIPVASGGSATAAVAVTRTEFAGAVGLSVPTVLPAGLSATVTQQPGTGNFGEVRFSLASNHANFSNLPVTIRASGNGIASVEATLTVNIATSGSVSLSMAPTSLNVTAGGSATTIATLSRTNFTGSVTLSVPTVLPAGLTATVAQQPGAGSSGSIRFDLASNHASFSNLPVTIRASGAGIATVERTVTISPTGSGLGVGFGAEQFVVVPSGTFQMGQTGIATPVRTVTISRSFQMQRTEVTQGQWRAVMGTNPSFFSSCGDNCPVENVSWLDVQSFLTQLNQREPGRGYRLPTEAEWEYAARAGTSGDYGTSGSICTFAWVSDCGMNSPSPVARKAANPWGLYDMHGNVWEWVSDWFGTYPSTNQTDPTGPTAGTMRVARGGSFGRTASEARSAFRQPDVPGGRLTYSGIPQGGFRLVRNP